MVLAELAKGGPATSDDGQVGHSWTVDYAESESVDERWP